jgi:hypothetical protein
MEAAAALHLHLGITALMVLIYPGINLLSDRKSRLWLRLIYFNNKKPCTSGRDNEHTINPIAS